MKNFRDLQVWQKAHQLTLLLYNKTENFPDDEKYGLVSQIKRAASSVAANIAEGCGRSGDAELARYLQIAMGSASELEYHLLLAHELNMLDHANYDQIHTEVIEIKRMLATFIKKLRTN